MYTVIKHLEISAAHSLKGLDYESKCKNLHGHNWQITIYCRSEVLNATGMVIDFTKIKEKISSKLDHKNLDEVLEFQTTAEMLARWISREIPFCYKCKVKESNNNIAIYENL